MFGPAAFGWKATPKIDGAPSSGICLRAVPQFSEAVMPRDFSAELNEFIAVVSAPLEPGETAVNRVERGWVELTDVIGVLVDDVDAENRDAELGRLKMEAVGAATRALAALPK